MIKFIKTLKKLIMKFNRNYKKWKNKELGLTLKYKINYKQHNRKVFLLPKKFNYFKMKKQKIPIFI